VSDLDGVAEPGAWVLGRIFSGLDQGNWFAYALVDLGEPAWSDTADTEMPPEMAQLLREEVGRTLGSVRIVHGSAAELAYAEPAGAVDLETELRAHLGGLVAQRFESAPGCEELARVISAPSYVRAVMNRLRTASNKKYRCQRHGSPIEAPEKPLVLARAQQP